MIATCKSRPDCANFYIGKAIPKRQERIDHIANWRLQCKQTQNQLSDLVKQATFQTQKLNPKNVPKEHKKLTSFIKREADDAQERYEQSLKVASNNKFNCNNVLIKDHMTIQAQHSNINVDKSTTKILNTFNNVNINKRNSPFQERNITMAIERDPRAAQFIPALISMALTTLAASAAKAYTATTFIKNSVDTVKWTKDKVNPDNTNPAENEYTNDQVIIEMLHEKEFEKLINENMKLTMASNCQIKVSKKTRQIAAYIGDVYHTITSIILSKEDPTPQTFITDNMFQILKNTITDKYGVNPPKSIKYLKAKMTVTETSYIATISIPLEYDKSKCDVYKIMAAPQENMGKYYIPDITPTIFAANTRTSEYTVITELEYSACSRTPFCSSSNPTFSSKMAPCGVATFYGMDDKCIYKATEEKEFYYTAGAKTFYSIPKGQVKTFQVSCLQDNRRGIASNQEIKIKNRGHFSMKIGCFLSDSRTILRPNTRNLYDPIQNNQNSIENFPQEKEEDYEEEHILNTATDDITSDLEIHKIALYVLSSLAVIIPMIIVWICKRCASTKLQTCCLPFNEKDIKTLEKHIDKRPERKKKREKETAERMLHNNLNAQTATVENQHYEMQIVQKNNGTKHKRTLKDTDPQTRELAPLLKTKLEKPTTTNLIQCHLCPELVKSDNFENHCANTHDTKVNVTSFTPALAK